MEKKYHNPIQIYGKKGLGIMFYTAILMFICGCVNTGMTQTVLPIISENTGWDLTYMLSWITYGSWIGIFACIAWGQMMYKKGAKIVAVIGLIGGGIAIFLYGHATILPVFCLAIVLNRLFSTAYQNNAANALVSNWFPKKKGIVFGWVTMGIIFVDIAWTPLITYGISAVGLGASLNILMIMFLALAVVGLLFIKNTPEEAGTYPDNDQENIKDINAWMEKMKAYRSPWSVKHLLSQKVVWFTGIGIGLLWLCAVGCLSQNVTRIMSFGYERVGAVRIVSISAVFALFGSWAFGKIDTCYGTKKACIVYSIAQLLYLVLMLLQPAGNAVIWISVCMLYSCMGGIANLAPSMIGTLFGRMDFVAANRLLNPIIYAIYSSAFLVVSKCIHIFGNLNSIYIVFFVLTLVGFLLVSFIDVNSIQAQAEKK